VKAQFPTFTIGQIKKQPLPLMQKVRARLVAQIQAEEDRRIFEVLDVLGTESIHLLDFLLENSQRLVAEYHPQGKLCSIRIVNSLTMGAVYNPSHVKEVIYLYDNGERMWVQKVPNKVHTTSVRGAGRDLYTLAQELCMAVAFAIYAHPESLDRTAAMEYFEREKSNTLWQEFLNEVERQQTVASITES